MRSMQDACLQSGVCGPPGTWAWGLKDEFFCAFRVWGLQGLGLMGLKVFAEGLGCIRIIGCRDPHLILSWACCWVSEWIIRPEGAHRTTPATEKIACAA